MSQGGRARCLASLLAVVYLAAALPVLGDFGPTWDFVQGDYPYGERLLEYLQSGDERFLDLGAKEPAPPVRAPHPDFDQARFDWYQISPTMALLSALSCRTLWTELGLVPAMAAHHVPAVLVAAVLVFVVTSWSARRSGMLSGLVAGGVLAADPIFFGHSCHNLKDVAECCFYTLAVLAGFVALEPGRSARERGRWWLIAGGLSGLALVQKPNAVFLPVQLLLFLAGGRILLARSPELRPRLGWRDLLWAVPGFLALVYLVSPAYWNAPIAGPRQVIAQFLHASTRPMDLELMGATAWEVLQLVLYSSPVLVLALAMLGALGPGLGRLERWFLLLGLCLPVARNCLPGMRHYDGTRHFLEYLPMLAMLAGNGARALQAWLSTWTAPRHALPVCAAVAGLALVPGGFQIVATHPNQIVYLNAFAGGFGGAQARGMRHVGDYWGNSYWQGLRWLSEHAEPGASVIVPVGAHVARAGAPVRLRPDLRILAESEASAGPIYVMSLVRHGRGLKRIVNDELTDPVHEIRVQGGAVLRIHRLQDDELGNRIKDLWENRAKGRGARSRILDALGEGEALSQAVEILESDATLPEAVEKLKLLLPDESEEDIEAAVIVYRRSRE